MDVPDEEQLTKSRYVIIDVQFWKLCIETKNSKFELISYQVNKNGGISCKIIFPYYDLQEMNSVYTSMKYCCMDDMIIRDMQTAGFNFMKL